ncbi:MAG: bifunctional phosphoribosyl-AMP cyclohydrolase/phosphoribosyl-ATP diphosphatase HisIE [Planctomycetes bacterium]|nr:bifunctional phosphoribosyl-AMP cyclohydrolase/phosphoribosyl-ATP diphosphatase HisIE [Planctomycetota bacterium]
MSEPTERAPAEITHIKWDESGLVPCVMQDAITGDVLTLAWMNPEAFRKTLQTGLATFWSRSRKELWTKGETSGNTMRLVELKLDCDGDALIARVIPAGPACHTGAKDCFFNPIHADAAAQAEVEKAQGDKTPAGWGAKLGTLMEDVRTLLTSRKTTLPEGSYSTYLFKAGLDKILKKCGEEMTETVIAAKGTDKAALVGEICDTVFHLLVLMAEKEISLEDLRRVMAERHGQKGGNTRQIARDASDEEHVPNMKVSRPAGCDALEARLMKQLDPAIRADVTRALEVMYRSHSGQKRDEGVPYATHPLEVAIIAVEDCKLRSRDEVIAALLHDVLEDDMNLEPARLTEQFGPIVAAAVVTLTKMYKRDGTPREHGLRRYYEGLRGASAWVRAVKICDRVHNLRTIERAGHGPAHVEEYRKATRENLLPLCATSTDPKLLKAGELLLVELQRK